MTTIRNALFATAAAIGLTLAAMPADAALVSCPADFTADTTGKVRNGTDTAASACQYITPADQNNVASVANVNAAGFFGFTDWADNGQTQLAGAGSVGASGTWSIANVDFDEYDYIIVFKDGSDTNLIAFLFNEEFSSGIWSTPFTHPTFNLKNDRGNGPDQKDVSHLSILKRSNPSCTQDCDPTDVPVPGVLGLLGAGLIGLGLAARRRRK